MSTDVLLYIAAFAGGFLAAAFGALVAFVFTGLVLLVGIAVLIATGDRWHALASVSLMATKSKSEPLQHRPHCTQRSERAWLTVRALIAGCGPRRKRARREKSKNGDRQLAAEIRERNEDLSTLAREFARLGPGVRVAQRPSDSRPGRAPPRPTHRGESSCR